MNDIEIYGNYEKGQNFTKSLEKKKFLFSLVISYTETCEIPRITVAGENPDFLKFTSPADAEFLHYGYCKCIDSIPMTPDGKPTPALITKVGLESASIPNIIINAGSKVKPQVPFFETGLEPGKNISQEPAMDTGLILQAIDRGRILGRTLASVTDCLVIGESIPGGTTTAMATLHGFGFKAKVSSSKPDNPLDLKNRVIEEASKRTKSKEPFDVIANFGDPMIPLVAGMISSASQISKVILAGGTQMAAVLALGKFIGYDNNNVAIGTTSYIINDSSSNFLKIMEEVADIPIIAVNPHLEKSKISGLQSYADGYVKEGAGAGGSLISSILKTGTNSQKLLQLIETEYQRTATLR